MNKALEHIGSQSQITSFNDGSPEAAAANVIYTSTIQALLRQSDWDFARKEASLQPTGLTAPLSWQIEYFYPTDGIEVRQLYTPAAESYNPQPVRWAEGTNNNGARVLWANLLAASVVYTWNATESEWDTMFIETAVRAVAAALAMSIAGRPDFAAKKMEEAEFFTNLAATRDY